MRPQRAADPVGIVGVDEVVDLKIVVARVGLGAERRVVLRPADERVSAGPAAQDLRPQDLLRVGAIA